MAYYLRQTKKAKGIYLQVYESSWNKELKQSRSRSVEAIGYIDIYSSSGVALAERMDLPNIRSKRGKMLHTAFYGQALVRKSFLCCEIIIKDVFDAIPRCVGNSIAFQHPFLFRILYWRI